MEFATTELQWVGVVEHSPGVNITANAHARCHSGSASRCSDGLAISADSNGLSLNGGTSLNLVGKAVSLFADHLISTTVALESVSDVTADNTVVAASGPT